MPRTIVTFTESLHITVKNPYIFAISAYRGMAGGVLGLVESLLAEKNLSLAYGMTIKSAANYIEVYNPCISSAIMFSDRARKAALIAANRIMDMERVYPYPEN